MKTPDQNNLPKNKQEAEKNLNQQPKISKEVIKGILAGIGSLPAIQAIGQKMNPPKVDNSESITARAAQTEDIAKYDERIKNIQKKLTSLGDNIQSYDETKAEELSDEISNLNRLKLGRAEFMDDVIAKKEAKEKEKFANTYPEAALKELEKERVRDDQYLTEQFENAKNIDDKAALGGEINAQILRHAERKSELESIVNQKKQDKINEKSKSKMDLKELDRNVIQVVKNTLQKARDEDKELNRQKIVQKEKDSELKKLKKVQDDGLRLTAKANKLSEKAAIKQENEVFSIFDINEAREERLTTLKDKQNKQESKWSNEVTAKKSKRSPLDRLKNSVGGAINKVKDQSKLNTEARNEANKENNPNFKPNQFAAKAAEQMKTAFNKIKDSMKVDHDKEPIVIQKLNELKVKSKNSKANKLDISNIKAKINIPKLETGEKSNFDKLKEKISETLNKKKLKADKNQSKELQKLNAEVLKKSIDLEDAKKLMKKMEIDIKKEAKNSTDSAEYNILDRNLKDLDNFIKEITIEVKNAEEDAIAQKNIEAQMSSSNHDNKSELAENKAKAEKEIEELIVSHFQQKKELKDKQLKIKMSHNPNLKSFADLNIQIKKLDDDFNKAIEKQKSILDDLSS